MGTLDKKMNQYIKVAIILTLPLLAFVGSLYTQEHIPLGLDSHMQHAVPTPPPGLTICQGEFALCAASTCKPVMNEDGTQRMITNSSGDSYPEVVCRCPILNGPNIADTSMGNMQGSCEATDKNHVWSTFWPRLIYPQEANNFSHKPEDMKVVIQNCPAKDLQGYNASNCFSWNCVKGPDGIAICSCPMGQVPPATGFLIEAGQGDPEACKQHPVSFPYSPAGSVLEKYGITVQEAAVEEK
jgi:hypothetical protein